MDRGRDVGASASGGAPSHSSSLFPPSPGTNSTRDRSRLPSEASARTRQASSSMSSYSHSQRPAPPTASSRTRASSATTSYIPRPRERERVGSRAPEPSKTSSPTLSSRPNTTAPRTSVSSSARGAVAKEREKRDKETSAGSGPQARARPESAASASMASAQRHGNALGSPTVNGSSASRDAAAYSSSSTAQGLRQHQSQSQSTSTRTQATHPSTPTSSTSHADAQQPRHSISTSASWRGQSTTTSGSGPGVALHHAPSANSRAPFYASRSSQVSPHHPSTHMHPSGYASAPSDTESLRRPQQPFASPSSHSRLSRQSPSPQLSLQAQQQHAAPSLSRDSSPQPGQLSLSTADMKRMLSKPAPAAAASLSSGYGSGGDAGCGSPGRYPAQTQYQRERKGSTPLSVVSSGSSCYSVDREREGEQADVQRVDGVEFAMHRGGGGGGGSMLARSQAPERQSSSGARSPQAVQPQHPSRSQEQQRVPPPLNPSASSCLHPSSSLYPASHASSPSGSAPALTPTPTRNTVFATMTTPTASSADAAAVASAMRKMSGAGREEGRRVLRKTSQRLRPPGPGNETSRSASPAKRVDGAGGSRARGEGASGPMTPARELVLAYKRRESRIEGAEGFYQRGGSPRSSGEPEEDVEPYYTVYGGPNGPPSISPGTGRLVALGSPRDAEKRTTTTTTITGGGSPGGLKPKRGFSIRGRKESAASSSASHSPVGRASFQAERAPPQHAEARERHRGEGGMLWKLMKRISTGGLRDKFDQPHNGGESVPPVPALPVSFSSSANQYARANANGRKSSSASPDSPLSSQENAEPEFVARSPRSSTSSLASPLPLPALKGLGQGSLGMGSLGMGMDASVEDVRRFEPPPGSIRTPPPTTSLKTSASPTSSSSTTTKQQRRHLHVHSLSSGGRHPSDWTLLDPPMEVASASAQLALASRSSSADPLRSTSSSASRSPSAHQPSRETSRHRSRDSFTGPSPSTDPYRTSLSGIGIVRTESPIIPEFSTDNSINAFGQERMRSRSRDRDRERSAKSKSSTTSLQSGLGSSGGSSAPPRPVKNPMRMSLNLELVTPSSTPPMSTSPSRAYPTPPQSTANLASLATPTARTFARDRSPHYAEGGYGEREPRTPRRPATSAGAATSATSPRSARSAVSQSSGGASLLRSKSSALSVRSAKSFSPRHASSPSSPAATATSLGHGSGSKPKARPQTAILFRSPSQSQSQKRTEREKDRMWNELMEKSRRAGGTLHIGGEVDKLESDGLRFEGAGEGEGEGDELSLGDAGGGGGY